MPINLITCKDKKHKAKTILNQETGSQIWTACNLIWQHNRVVESTCGVTVSFLLAATMEKIPFSFKRKWSV